MFKMGFTVTIKINVGPAIGPFVLEIHVVMDIIEVALKIEVEIIFFSRTLKVT